MDAGMRRRGWKRAEISLGMGFCDCLVMQPTIQNNSYNFVVPRERFDSLEREIHVIIYLVDLSEFDPT